MRGEGWLVRVVGEGWLVRSEGWWVRGGDGVGKE